MRRKPIPQRWLDSGCITLGPGWWELENGEPHDVLDGVPAGNSDRDGRACALRLLPDRREGG